MNNIAIGRETMRIISDCRYSINGKEVLFPEVDFNEVIVISPKDGEGLVKEDFSAYDTKKMCRVIVENADSFQAAKKYEHPLVMNFANAHNPGGGFLMGATAQEEALCRCSTLYSSITSDAAKEMYHYNNSHVSDVESDYMLLSPNVIVFRNEKCGLIPDYFTVGVVTVPAPNRRGMAIAAPEKKIEETMVRRIRIMLAAAVKYGYGNLVLGAWGCGAFGNSAKKVAGYFKQVIADEGYGRYFDEISFAVYGSEKGHNITAFREVWE